MSKSKNNNGFTLIEVVVVIVIMSILMAVAVPSVMKYLGVGAEAKAIDEAYACVSAADYYATRAYTKDKEVALTENFRKAILKKAQVEGTVQDATYVNYKITRFVYKSPNRLTVLFENNKYMIVEDADRTPTNVVDMMYALKTIETEENLQNAPNDASSYGPNYGRTYRLQDEFLKKYENKYPSLSTDEIKMITSRNFKGNAEKLVWKPIYDSYGNIFLVADSKSAAGELKGAAQGPLIYYTHQYYYGKHGSTPTIADSIWIKEGSLTTEFLNERFSLIQGK